MWLYTLNTATRIFKECCHPSRKLRGEKDLPSNNILGPTEEKSASLLLNPRDCHSDLVTQALQQIF